MKTTFIYFLKDPENPMKGYVGKTNNPTTRLSRHFQECRDERHYRANWLKSLAARKLTPTLEVVDEVPFEYWPQLEVAYIEFFRERGYQLVNSTKGGEGVNGGPLSPEHRAKLSVAKKGKKLSFEHRAALREIAVRDKAHKWFGKTNGAKNSFFGRKHSPESCAKIAAAQLGKKHSAETKEKMSIAGRARKSDTPETRLRKSLAASKREANKRLQKENL